MPDLKRFELGRPLRAAAVSNYPSNYYGLAGGVELATMKRRHDAKYMTTIELAELLRVHPATLYKLLRQGQIPVFKIGSDYRFDRDVIEKWMLDRQVKRHPN